MFPGASVQVIGDGCGEASPKLAATDPAFASTFTVTGRAFTAGKFLWLLMSRQAPPTAFPPCVLFVDATAVSVLHAMPLAQPTWQLSTPLPVLPALTGIPIVLQALQGPSAAALGADLSNGLVATFGL